MNGLPQSDLCTHHTKLEEVDWKEHIHKHTFSFRKQSVYHSGRRKKSNP